MVLRFTHFSNALFPIVLTVSGITTSVIAGAHLKILSGTLTVPSAKTTFVKFVQFQKTPYSLTVVNVDGILTSEKEVQPSNAWLPNPIMPSCKSIDLNAEQPLKA